MILTRILEATRPYEPKPYDPALLTSNEWLKLINPKSKHHDSESYNWTLAQMNEPRRGDRYSEYPILLNRLKKRGLVFEIRLNKEDRFDRKFCKMGPDGEYLRDEKNQLIPYTKEELLQTGWRRYDYSFGIFNDERQIVGVAQDEWGCVLVAVAQEYRGFGFGELLSHLAREYEPGKDSGGMTSAGHAMGFRVHREAVRRYLQSGFYRFLIRSGQVTMKRVREILASVDLKRRRRDRHKDVDYGTSDTSKWMLYVGDAGDFVIYDRKLKDIVERYDEEEIDRYGMRMILGARYAGPYNEVAKQSWLHVFGGVNDKIKKFLLFATLSYIADEDPNETIRLRPFELEYAQQRGIEVLSDDLARLTSNEPFDYKRLAIPERQFRKSFDKYDEFKTRLIEMADMKYSVHRQADLGESANELIGEFHRWLRQQPFQVNVDLIAIDENNVTIEHMSSEIKNQGHATKVLKALCDLADAHGTVLNLQPMSHADYGEAEGGLSQDDLIMWYEKFGFELDYATGLMHRQADNEA